MATFSSIQRGTLTISSGNASGTATITAVTLANSILWFSVKSQEANPKEGNIRANITATTTVTAYADGTTSNDVTVEYQVIEFSSGVTVQRGTVASILDTGNNVTISAVTLAEAFPIISTSDQGAGMAQDDFVRAEITTTTNLYLESGQGTCNDLEWQVVNYTGATVQKVNISDPASLPDDQTVTTVTLADTFVQVSWNAKAAVGFGFEDCAYAYLTSTTNLRFDTIDSQEGKDYDYTAYVIEHTDFDVQRGLSSFTTAETADTASISAITIANSIVNLTNYGGFFGSNAAGGDNFDSGSVLVKFNSTTEVGATRIATDTAACEWCWQVIEWGAAAGRTTKNTDAWNFGQRHGESFRMVT